MARLESHEKGDDDDEIPSSSELWTLQEEAQGVAPSYQFVPLTRAPASFSTSTNDDQAPPPTTAAIAPRGRAGSYDTVGNEEVWSAGGGGGASGGGDCLVNSEGFPLLLRRRTFTEPSLGSKRRCVDNDGGGLGRGGHHYRTGGGGGGRGRVPMSVSEDSMLSLLSKRSSQALMDGAVPVLPPTPATTPNKLLERDVTTSSSVSNSSGSTAPMQQQQQQQQQDEEQPNPAAERARRNEFVLRCAFGVSMSNVCIVREARSSILYGVWFASSCHNFIVRYHTYLQ